MVVINGMIVVYCILYLNFALLCTNVTDMNIYYFLGKMQCVGFLNIAIISVYPYVCV